MSAKKPAAPRKPSPARLARDEPDAEWRQWFTEVERRRKESSDPKRQPWIASRYDKEGDGGTIIRRRVEPKKISAFIKQDAKKSGRSLGLDLQCIQSAWTHAVGGEIAAESGVYAFKNGVLTIEIYSSSLLQEIRQFHQDAILKDLRDIWQVSIPLLRIVYKLGKASM